VVVKKDRQHNCYTLAYPKKYVTNILPDSLTKTNDATQVILLTIFLKLIQSEKQVRLERKSASISLPNYYRKSLSQITKISRFTSINDRTNRVPINQLLVNNLLPDRTFLSNPIAHPPKKYDRPFPKKP
jgi:hypothetical protein